MPPATADAINRMIHFLRCPWCQERAQLTIKDHPTDHPTKY